MSEERLQKVLAQAGIASRRAAEDLIASGRVTVDGRVVTELGVKVDPEAAEIRVDGEPIAAEKFRYVILHKPAGYMSHPDPRADYPSWQELVKVPERLFAVGRLDADSEGLLLLTNDGELANHLMHPRYEHPRTYLVQVEGIPNPRKIRRLQHGVMLEDGPTAPARVGLVREPPPVTKMTFRSRSTAGPARGEAEPAPRSKPPVHRVTAWLQVTLREGRKRQLRRMVALLGHPALRVIRVGLGPLALGDLRPGKWRDLTPGEVRALRSLIPPAKERQHAETLLGLERKESPLVPSTIAIDGPAASGKSTVGGRLARDLGYLYFDTGVMYRAVTWVALLRGVPLADEAAVTRLAQEVRLDVLPPTVADGRDVTVLADDEDITRELRRPEVDLGTSPVSSYPGVRQALTLQQRRIAESGQVVMVGRDIGTVVLPGAELKIYLDASLAERAQRRYRERQARGERVEFERVLADVRKRDQNDSTRQHAPLKAAKDAIVVDSTNLTVEEVLRRVRGLIERWRARAGRTGS